MTPAASSPFPVARPWSGTRARVCVRRGRFHLGPIELRSGDPLGIFTSRLEFGETPEVIVYPAVVELREAGIPEGALSGGSALERRTPHVTPNVAGVRDYTPSDGFNRISWSATARLGRLMVKEFDQDPTADVWIVLDLHDEPAPPRHPPRELGARRPRPVAGRSLARLDRGVRGHRRRIARAAASCRRAATSG